MAAEEPTPATGEERSLALRLVNTRVSGTGGVVDRLATDDAVDRWLERHLSTGTMTPEGRSALRGLREDARALLSSIEERSAPASALLERINAAGASPVRPKLHNGEDRLGLDWLPVRAETPIAEVAREVATFAVSADAARVRTCAADDCDRLFLQDHGRRIWCSPGCGNRMRARRHAARARRTRTVGA